MMLKIFELKKSLLAVSMTSILLLGATDVMADNHGKGVPECGKTELSEQMEEMKDHLKAYKKAAGSENWDVMAKRRDSLMELTLSSQDELPFKAYGKPEDEQKTMQANYRKGMEHLKDLLTQLEQAERERNIAQVEAVLEEIGKHSKKGHRAFKQKCDDE